MNQFPVFKSQTLSCGKEAAQVSIRSHSSLSNTNRAHTHRTLSLSRTHFHIHPHIQVVPPQDKPKYSSSANFEYARDSAG